MTDLSAAPDNILHIIRCNCSSFKKNLCSTNICSSRKHGLLCLVVILHVVIVNLVDCENCENEIDMDDVSDEVENRNLMSLTIDEKRSEIISLVLRTFKHRKTLKFNHHE